MRRGRGGLRYLIPATALIAVLGAPQAALAQAAATPAPQEELTPAQRALNLQPERMFQLTVPVFYDRTPIASINAKVATGGGFEADREDVLKVLGNVLNEAALAEVEAALAGVETVTPAEASQAGFQMVFDPQIVGLRLTTDRDARADTDLRLSEPFDNSGAFERSPPYADVSAFLNLIAGAQLEVDDDTEIGALLGADGAMRALDFVLRGSVLYDTADEEFEVGSVQLIRDFINYDIRATAGDINTVGGDLIGTEDVIGLSLSHRAGRFGRARALEPLTSETFDLDRSATVEIYVNDTLRRRLRLAPGRFNISDFGLTSGANEIRIVTIDDTGQRDEIILTSFSDSAILAPGDLRWEVAAGYVTEDDLADFDFDFDDSDFVATARVLYGLSNQISFGAAGIIRDQGQAASLSVDTALPIGFVGLDVAGSNANGEIGGAASLVYSPYLPEFLEYPGRSLSFSAFAASESFSNIAIPDADNEQYRFAARWTEPFLIFDTPVRTSLFGSYQRFADDDDEQYQIGATAGFTIDPGIGVSLGAAWERDIDGVDEFVATLALTKAFGDNYRTSAAYSTDNNTVLAAASYQNQFGGVGTVQAAVAAESSDLSDAAVSGTVSYTGNRFNIAASHFQEVVDNDDSGEIGSTTTVTATTALVFADGELAISRPVSDSFAIVKRHESLGEVDITLNPGRENVGPGMESDFLGPLVANDVGSYATSNVRVKVEGLPLGYDLGQGLFEVAGPLNAGYVLQLGSDRAASATGTFLTATGEPLEFAAGRVTSPDDPGFVEQKIFTNKAGRFLVQSLVPGRRYVIRLQGIEGETEFMTEPDKYGLNQIGLITTNVR